MWNYGGMTNYVQIISSLQFSATISLSCDSSESRIGCFPLGYSEVYHVAYHSCEKPWIGHHYLLFYSCNHLQCCFQMTPHRGLNIPLHDTLHTSYLSCYIYAAEVLLHRYKSDNLYFNDITLYKYLVRKMVSLKL